MWVADINNLEPVNIQPQSVGGIDQEELFQKKAELGKQGKDIDSMILYWVSKPILSPSEDKIAFSSNRDGYPENLKLALWVTDLAGNTKKLVDKTVFGDIVPVAWVNDEEFVFIGAKGELKKVDVNSSKVDILISEKVMVAGTSPDGRFIMFQYVKDGMAQPEQYLFNTKENKPLQLAVPAGYKNNGFYGWDKSGSKVAFYVQDFSANVKLIVLDCVSLHMDVLDAPDGLKFDDNVVPSWSDGKVVFSAGGQLYTTK
ncbi:MAG: hypothetical protein ACOY3J_08275 [Bacillota bacterium]